MLNEISGILDLDIRQKILQRWGEKQLAQQQKPQISLSEIFGSRFQIPKDEPTIKNIFRQYTKVLTHQDDR